MSESPLTPSEPSIDERKIPPGADLHCHSVYSDGTETPPELLARADGRLSLISICDHDTIEAYDVVPPERSVAHATAWPASGALVLPGVEITARLGEERHLHLLGYFPAGFTVRFREAVGEFAAARTDRTRRALRAIRDRGIPLRREQLDRHHYSPGVPCRSHLSRALIELGVARNPNTLFRRFFSTIELPAAPIEAAEASRLIRDEGGLPVWAHPAPNDLDDHVERLTTAGLVGLEGAGPSTTPRKRNRVRGVAEKFGLFITAGSDHHGVNPDRPFGTWRGLLEKVPAELLPARLYSSRP